MSRESTDEDVCAPARQKHILSTNRDPSSHWSVLDQISLETAHSSFGDQSAADVSVLNRLLPYKSARSRPTVGGNSEFSSRLDEWNRLNLVKEGKTRGTLPEDHPTPTRQPYIIEKPNLKALKMMQISSDSASNKHSLINVMHRFMAAANNMDETIMVPSLLRDLPLEEQVAGEVEANNNNEPQCPNKQRDMYEHYLLLKSIKNDMEWGLLKREMSSGASFLEMAVKQQQEEREKVTDVPQDENSDLEHQFHFHLRGLFGVLSKLTLQADHLTNRYKREIGGGNFLR